MHYGKIINEPENLYRNSGAIGSSELNQFIRNEALWDGYRTGKWQRESTQALAFGRLLHAMVLQPEVVKDMYAVMPKADGRTKEGKAIKGAFHAANPGKEIVTADDMALAEAMNDAILQNDEAVNALTGDHEVTYRCKDPVSGLNLQCRTDNIHEGLGLIGDLKSTDCLDKFRRSVESYGYHRQAALYRYVVSKVLDIPIDLIQFAFVAVEKNPPYAVGVYMLDEDYMNQAEIEMREGLNRMALVKAGAKPRRDPEGVQVLSQWKRKAEASVMDEVLGEF